MTDALYWRETFSSSKNERLTGVAPCRVVLTGRLESRKPHSPATSTSRATNPLYTVFDRNKFYPKRGSVLLDRFNGRCDFS